MDYTVYMLEELQRLEALSTEYSGELRFLSKKIRKDFWNKKNTEALSQLLYALNNIYEAIFKYSGYFDLSCIFAYVRMLAKCCFIVCKDLDAIYYNQLLDDIQMESSRLIIEEQWKDITASKDGYKSFKGVFSEIFEKCLTGNRKKFFHELKDSDVLCRVVDDKYKINKERFIPWDSVKNNRWNPPGRAFLYLSFSEKDEKYSDDLTVNEYICLEEYKAKKGNKYYFCNFRPATKGNIFDLSYNDVSLRQIGEIIDDYQSDICYKMIEEIMREPRAIEKYKDLKTLKKKVKKIQPKYLVDNDLIEESFAKQYLKMICNCIYKKVDEKDEAKKEIAYKSFWALATYLEEQGVTGIIYPCTRTNKIIGKNLVLFNKYDAEPIEGSIRERDY